MPRVKKYHTDEERREANREKSRRYYQRNRALVLSKRMPRKKDAEARLSPGRPRKYFTKEERDKAKRNYARRYYERHVKKTTFSLRRAMIPQDLREPALPRSTPEWVTPTLSQPFSELQTLQTRFRWMTSGSLFETLKGIVLQYLKTRDTNDFDKQLAKYNELLKKASIIEDVVLTLEGVEAHQSAREMSSEIRRLTFWIEDLMSQALIHGYAQVRKLFHEEKLGFQVAWRRVDSTACLQEGTAMATGTAKTMALPYPYGLFISLMPVKRHTCEPYEPVKAFRVKVERRVKMSPKFSLVPVEAKTPKSTSRAHSKAGSGTSSKRRKISHPSPSQNFDPLESQYQDEWVDDDIFVPFSSSQLEPKSGNTPNDYMREWLDKEQEYLYEIILRDYCSLICQACSKDSGDMWRCKDCFGSPVHCTGCLRTTHTLNPFHRVEIWKETHFSPSWLWKTGLRLSLCRLGSCSRGPDSFASVSSDTAKVSDCTFDAKPTGRATEDAKVLVIVHTNGVHQIPFQFCECDGWVEEDIQLLRMGFYPASHRDVKTVFTFAVLDAYLLENLECYTSAFHFYSKLRRLTNEVFPKHVPDRYREGLRCGRQWRKLKDLKRYGFGHTGTTPEEGGMALFCAACPQPGVNLPEDWLDDDQQWKYGITLAADGNFSLLHRQQKRNDDFWLKNGEGYLVERLRYEKHLKNATEVKESPTCHEHRAVEDKSKTTKGCDVTGVGAFACSRHGCFVPAGVVNFHKGERQMYMDYGLCRGVNSIGITKGQRLVLLYDINCQYSRNLRKRLEEGRRYLDLPEGLDMVFGIGQFHVHGHQEKCYARFSPMFIKGIGYTSGEILESLWSVLNEASRPTQTMSLAHRTEVLDALIGDSNWKKMINLLKSIPSAYERSIKELEEAREAFDLLNDTASPSQRSLWHRQLERAQVDRVDDVSAMDILNVTLSKPPSRAKIQHGLMVEELDANVGLGVTSWLVRGFKIQESQLQLKAYIRSLPRPALRTEIQELEIVKKREALQAEIVSFCASTQILFPDVDLEDYRCFSPPESNPEIEGEDGDKPLAATDSGENPFVDVADPEEVDIPLPSAFDDLPSSMRMASRKEIKLRAAQATDALEDVRTEIGRKSYLYRSNIRLADGKKQKTRGYAAVKASNQAMRMAIRIYDQARWALTRLGASKDLLGELKPITREDTKAITAVYRPNTAGESRTKLSWIWGVNVVKDSQNSQYLEELYRVNWLRAKSRVNRWEEEKQLLEEEMDWVCRFFDKKAETCLAWRELAGNIRPGHQAYASRQAETWRLLSSEAKTCFQKARRKVQSDEGQLSTSA